MKKRNNNRKAGILEKSWGELAGLMSIIEIHSDYELILSGCRGIVDYSCDSIVVDTISGTVFIKGRCLCLDVFRGDMLCISGRIISVQLGEEIC